MIKKIFSIGISALCVLGLVSCEDNGKDEYLNQYATILYFHNDGLQLVNCYVTGDSTDYKFSIIKAGSERTANANVSVNLMSEEQLSTYNSQNGTNYQFLPTYCYSFGGTNLNLSFNSSESYKILDVYFDPVKIKASSGENYVLPLILTSEKDSINKNKKELLINPSVITPSIGFQTSGVIVDTLSSSDPESVILPISSVIMPVENKWSFQCSLSVDENLLENYNQSEKVHYQMLPEGTYSLNTTLKFVPDSSQVSPKFILDRTKLNFGAYLLPLRITDCTQPYFKINDSADSLLTIVKYLPDRIPLTLNMLSSNATVIGDGTGLSGLIDGIGAGKHYHSDYSGTVKSPYGHYIDIHLKTAIKTFMFKYWTRYENGNGAPQDIELYTSNDGINWVKRFSINSNLPTTGNSEYDSDIFTVSEPFTFVRFSVIRSVAGVINEQVANYFNLGELQLYGK